jgi:Holliday junction resolvase-like predicted endonuclease
MSELRYRIIRAAECFISEMYANTWRETEYRFDVCRATTGAHLGYIEHKKNFVDGRILFK